MTILKNKLTGPYTGYVLKNISISKFNKEDILNLNYKKLKRVCHKITYFLHRDMIKNVYKSDCFKKEIDNYYLVIDINDNIYHLEY